MRELVRRLPAQGTRRARRGGGGGAADGDPARASYLGAAAATHGDPRPSRHFHGRAYDDDDDDERTTAAVAGTNLTREILHESPHYRQLVEHYRRRMGEPGYDPDLGLRRGATDSEIPWWTRRWGNRGTARGRGGSHTSRWVTTARARPRDRDSGQSGRGGERRGASGCRGEEVLSPLVSPIRRRSSLSLFLGVQEAHRFAGVPHPDIIPHPTRASIPRSGTTARDGFSPGASSSASDWCASGSRGSTTSDEAATVAPSPPSLLPPPIDEAGLGDGRARLARRADGHRASARGGRTSSSADLFHGAARCADLPCLHLLYCRRCVDRSSEANERRGPAGQVPVLSRERRGRVAVQEAVTDGHEGTDERRIRTNQTTKISKIRGNFQVMCEQAFFSTFSPPAGLSACDGSSPVSRSLRTRPPPVSRRIAMPLIEEIAEEPIDDVEPGRGDECSMTVDQKIQWSERLKLAGNAHFCRGNSRRPSPAPPRTKLFEMLYAVSATDEGYEAANERCYVAAAPLYNNLALCLYKQGKWKEAADACTRQSRSHTRTDAKSLLRRAACYAINEW